MDFSPNGDILRQFNEIWNRYQPYIKTLCEYKLKSMPDCAEDCMQETFEALLAAMLGGAEIKNPVAWLCTVANRQISNICNRERREALALAKPSQTGSLFCPDAAEESFQPREDEIKRAKEAVLLKLSEEDRLLLTERYMLNMKTADIAAAHGVEDNSIRQRLFRLRKKTEELIHEYISQNNL